MDWSIKKARKWGEPSSQFLLKSKPLCHIWAKSLLNYLLYGNLINIYTLQNTLLLSFSNKLDRQFVIDAHISEARETYFKTYLKY